MRTFLTLSILICVFAISVIIKIPYLTKDVHYNNHGHIITLTTLEIWDEKGIADCNFSPIQTRDNHGDKFISYYKRLVDNSGNNYFVSYPPFAFILPYIVMKTFNIAPSQNLLVVLGMCIHIISGFLLFICINKFLRNKIFEFSIPAILGFFALMFFPPLLFHSVNYFPGFVVIPLILLFLLFIISFTNSERNLKLWQIFLFGFIVFLMVFTDWLGLFTALTLIFYLMISKRKANRIFNKLLLTSIISTALSLLLMFIQYVSISGFNNLFRAMAIRFVERSGFFANNLTDQGMNYLNPDSYLGFFINLHNALSWIGYVILFSFVLLLIFWRRIKAFSYRVKFVSILIIAPVLLHFILFFNLSSIHFGSMTVLAIPFAFLAAYVICKFNNVDLKTSKYINPIFIVCFITASFLSLNTLENYLPNNEELQQKFNAKAKIISTNSSFDEAIFLEIENEFNTEIIYLSFLAKRNMMFVGSINEAKEILRKHNKSKGVIFYSERELVNGKIKHFQIEQQNELSH